jgi:hypothetical protein
MHSRPTCDAELRRLCERRDNLWKKLNAFHEENNNKEIVDNGCTQELSEKLDIADELLKQFQEAIDEMNEYIAGTTDSQQDSPCVNCKLSNKIVLGTGKIADTNTSDK